MKRGLNHRRRTSRAATCAGLLFLTLGTIPAIARNSGHPATIIAFGNWTAFCDNSGGCGVANVSTRRGAYAAERDADSPWACLWLGALNTNEASLSILLEEWQVERQNDAPLAAREVVVQPVRGASEQPVGTAAIAVFDGESRYRIGAEVLPDLLVGLREADAALLRESDGGPVMGRIALDGFKRALHYSNASRAEAREIPKITPKRFAWLEQAKAAISLELHRQHCGGERRRDLDISIYRMGDGQELWTTLCRQSGYNFKTLAIMSDRGGKKTPLELRSILDHDGVGPDLSNLAVHPELGTIEDYRKTRGAGDCGLRRRWAWTGQRFALISEDFMPECFGANHSQWLRMYRSEQPNATEPRRLPC